MNRNVVLVAFHDQDNLGVGYLASTLIDRGFVPYIVDFRLGPEEILRHVRRRAPVAVGFSIIFQYHVDEFRHMIEFLRRGGVTCHFTAGGHYPTLRWREALALAPGLDSIVRFEGERTLARLVDTLVEGGDWTKLPAIAHRAGAEPVTNAPVQEGDLDDLPPPVRPPLREYVLGRKCATLLASRGCAYDCAFCSIRRFYSGLPGPMKRLRRPEMVAREMRLLADHLGCSVFLFQDDDFPVANPHGAEWARQFCEALDREGLADRALFKVSCRPDEVNEDVFARLREHGLFLVYLGIESGTDVGLARMNKRSSVAKSLRAVELLRRLDVAFDFGFMLFDPWTTRDTVLEDLSFLEEICAAGGSSLTFCKMLPYAETEIERRLRSEGRIRGEPGYEDYDFLSDQVTNIHDLLTDLSFEWMGSRDGVLNASRWLRYAVAVAHRTKAPGLGAEIAELRSSSEALVGGANRFLIDVARTIVRMEPPVDTQEVAHLRRMVAERHAGLLDSIADLRETLDRVSFQPSA